MHHYQIPFCVIATKCDKLSRMACNKQKIVIARELCIGADNILTVSSQAKMGKKEILEKIGYLINTYK